MEAGVLRSKAAILPVLSIVESAQPPQINTFALTIPLIIPPSQDLVMDPEVTLFHCEPQYMAC